MTFWEMLRDDKEELAARLVHTVDLGDGEVHWAAPVDEKWPGETEMQVFDDFDAAWNAALGFLNSEIDYSALLEDEEGEPVDDADVSVDQFLP